MVTDAFDVNTLDSIVGTLVRSPRSITLSDYAIPCYEIKNDYAVTTFSLSSKGGKALSKEIEQAIKPVIDEAVRCGYDPNLLTALYEAVLNAHQHGNGFSREKNVTIASRFNDVSAEISVIDQGGVIPPELILYVLRHRQDRRVPQLDFYAFSGREKLTPENQGLGTHFMHTYADEVKYSRSAQGGLVVHLTKYKVKRD